MYTMGVARRVYVHLLNALNSRAIQIALTRVLLIVVTDLDQPFKPMFPILLRLLSSAQFANYNRLQFCKRKKKEKKMKQRTSITLIIFIVFIFYLCVISFIENRVWWERKEYRFHSKGQVALLQTQQTDIWESNFLRVSANHGHACATWSALYYICHKMR